MDPILATLFSWQFVIFGLAIATVVFVVRTTVEYLMANYTNFAKESKLWNELILPIFPVVLGAFSAWLIKTFPYPDGLTTSSSRVIFGLVAGLLSTLLYRVFKALLVQKIDATPAPSIAATVTMATNPSNNPARPVISPPSP